MKRRNQMIIMVVLFITLLGSLHAQQQLPPDFGVKESTIVVNLRFRSGQTAPAGILIQLSNQSGAEVSRQMSDTRGKVEFANLRPATYIVSVRNNDYMETQQRVNMDFSPTQTVYLELVPKIAAVTVNIPPGGPHDTISANLPASAEGRNSLEQGKTALFDKKDAAGSLVFFKQLNKSDPDYANGWVLTGTALMDLNQNEDAEKAFRKAVNKGPNNYAANFGLGVALNQLARYDEAIKPLQKSLEVNSESVEALYEMTRSELALNKWQEAEPFAAKAIALAPNFAPVHVSMGNIYLRKRDAVSALKEFETYLSLDPNGPFAAQTREITNKIKNALKSK